MLWAGCNQFQIIRTSAKHLARFYVLQEKYFTEKHSILLAKVTKANKIGAPGATLT